MTTRSQPRPSPVLCGERVRLRPPQRRDASALVGRGLSAAYLRFIQPGTRFRRRLTSRDVQLWYQELARAGHAWVIEVQGQCIGSVYLDTFGQPADRADYFIGILDPARWGQGYGTATTRLVLTYAFAELDLGSIALKVRTGNRRAIACYRRCGFVPVAHERDGRLRFLHMVCWSPHLPAAPSPPPRLILTANSVNPDTRQVQLTADERSFLGVAPGVPLALEVVAGDLVIAAPGPEAEVARG